MKGAVLIPRPARTAVAAACVLAVALAGCAGSDETSTGPPATTTTETAPARPIKVGLVTDVAGLDDRSFNEGAYEGLLRAQEELGIDGRVLESVAASDYLPNLASLAQDDVDLVVAVGARMADATDAAALKFPGTRFAIVDVSRRSRRHRPPNVRGILFKEQEGGYLAGYLAGLVVKEQGGEQVASTVGGMKTPPTDRYIAGFEAGARAANPGITMLNAYSRDPDDQARCKELALAQIDQGSQVVMQVAGTCGLGALDAARERNVWGIGTDADQSFLGPYILTSAVKLTAVALFQTIEAVRSGTFRGGEDRVFDVASGAVGLGRISPRIPNEVVAKAQQVQAELAAGRIAAIPTVVRPGA